MAFYIKTGMAGSRCGRGRSEQTEHLKSLSKTRRRNRGKKACTLGLVEYMAEEEQDQQQATAVPEASA